MFQEQQQMQQRPSKKKKRRKKTQTTSDDVFFITREPASGTRSQVLDSTPSWWYRIQNLVALRRRASVYPVDSIVLDTSLVDNSELLRALRPLILIGKACGSFPFSWNKRKMAFSINKYLLAYAILIAFNEAFVLCVRLKIFFENVDGSSSRQKAENLTDFIYIIFLLTCALITWTRYGQLPGFMKWACSMEAKLTRYKLKEDGLAKMCWWVTGTAFCLILLDHANYVTTVVFRAVEDSENFLTVFAEEYDLNRSFMGDSSVSGIYAILTETWMEVRWIFPDILLIVLSLVMSRFYKRFNQYVSDTVRSETSPEDLEQLRRDHALLTQMVERVDSLISPMTLISYVCNISYVLLRLYVGLDKENLKSFGFAQYEVIYTFIFMFARMLLPSLAAANLNAQAHRTLRYVNRWETFPSNMNNDEVKLRMLIMNRFAHQVMEPPIGLTGCGYFVITKPFITGLVGAVLTYEIVVLQFQSMNND